MSGKPTYPLQLLHIQMLMPQILHDIIIDLYSTESRLLPRERSGFVTRTRSRLEGLWKDVPDEAKFNPMQPSPPPNVFMFQ